MNAQNIVSALAMAIAGDVERCTREQASDAGPAAAALALLGNEPGATIARMRMAVGLSHPGAVRLVDRLVADGLVERRPGSADRRAVALHLTTQGVATSASVMRAKAGVVDRALARLTPAEVQVVTGLAAKMLGGLVRDSEHAFSICRFCGFDVCDDCPVDAELCERVVAPS